MVARVLAQGAPAAPAEPLAVAAPAVALPSAAPAPAREPAAPVAVREPAAPAPASAPTAPASAPVPPAAAPAPPATEAGPAAPAGPVTLQRMRDAWPEVLARLETISRSSWLIATVARVAGLDGDILTLSFQSQGDVAAFKKRTAGAGPSEDLRQAIQGVLGIRVKYIARHDNDEPGGPGGAGGSGGSGETPPAPRVTPPAATAPPVRPSSSAPVTDWAVATIPSDAPAEVASGPGITAPVAGQFPVDDEPEDAAAAVPQRTLTLETAREGAVLPSAEVAPSFEPEPDDPADEETYPVDLPAPAVTVPPVRLSAPAGIQRYGEAVIRQVLGARFVREEPFERPTRFA